MQDTINSLIEAGKQYIPYLETYDGTIIQRDNTGADDWYPTHPQQEFFCQAANARPAIETLHEEHAKFKQCLRSVYEYCINNADRATPQNICQAIEADLGVLINDLIEAKTEE